MTPAQPEAQAPYRTQAWCAVARGASDAERDQSRAACMPGKRGPKTGNDPRDPHRPGALTACRQMLCVARGEGFTTGPMGCGPGQGGSLDTGEGLLRNRKMRSYHSHTDSETRTVTVEPDCKDTTVMHVGPSADELQGLGPDWPHPWRMACENRRKKNA